MSTILMTKHKTKYIFKQYPYAAGGLFGQYKIMQKTWKMTEILSELSDSYPMNTNTTKFTWFSKIFASLSFGRKSSQQRKD